jgi:hypothetical protein
VLLAKLDIRDVLGLKASYTALGSWNCQISPKFPVSNKVTIQAVPILAKKGRFSVILRLFLRS